jgi:DNA-binding transcriptional ArsR family regulator
MANELKMPHRRIHPKLGIPVSTSKPEAASEINEKTLLEILAEDYRVNPGLFMTRADMKERLTGASDEQLNQLLSALETEGLVKLHKDRRGNITLAKATFKGLKQAKPKEYYQWYPEWLNKDLIF